MKTVTLGITTYGYSGAFLLQDCLRSIDKSVKESKYSNYDIIVVDDGTPIRDAKPAKVLCKKHGATYIRGRKNFGNVARYNMIVDKSEGDIIILIDNDLVLPDRWFWSIYHFLTNNKCGVASHISRKVTPKEVNTLLSMRRIKADGSGRKPERATELAGYCFGFTRENYELVGGFDSDNFKFFIGDSDFCCRLAQKGLMSYRLLYPIVYHQEHATYSKYDAELKAWERGRQDLANFKKKWKATPKEMEQKFLNEVKPQQIQWYANYAVYSGWDVEGIEPKVFEPVGVVDTRDVPRSYRSSNV